MLEIISQREYTKEGNDCLIEDCIVWMKCHDKHIVMNIRRYRGWCDNGVDFRDRKEFDDPKDAHDYYLDLVNNKGVI